MSSISYSFDVADEVEILEFAVDGSSPFENWLDGLRDLRGVGIIRARVNRLRLGNFGDCGPAGAGVEELRINFGPGYRVYFGRQGSRIVILLCGGSKRTQKKDIALAREYWKEYLDAIDRQSYTVSG